MKFSNTYIKLGEQFFQRTLPEKITSPVLLLWNQALAHDLLISQDLQNDKCLLSHYFQEINL